jgi:hypothetical protein
VHARFLALRIRWQQIEVWNMVPIITREGIDGFRAMPLTVATKKNARLRNPPAEINRGVDLISDALPFGRLWYSGPNAVADAIGYAEHRSRSHGAVIRVYDDAGNVIETHEHNGDFRECS